MGNSFIDLSLANIWKNWFKFKKGKKRTKEMEFFIYFLEKNLQELFFNLKSGKYKHGKHKKFIITDSKRRKISVANIRDRIIHRLVYEYLLEIYDKTFIFDAWSCRKNKGLLGAIERTQKFLNKYPNSFIWRSDIEKFFDSVNQKILLELLLLKIKDINAINILKEIISGKNIQCNGMPIGNLTSQIFANIYLNELDRFVKYKIKPQAYIRYGDDFLIISEKLDDLKQSRNEIIKFLKEKLELKINVKNDIIIKPKWGLKFLGIVIFSNGRKLNKRNWNRAVGNLNIRNIASYSGLVKNHSAPKKFKEFNWIIADYYEKQI